MDPFSLGDGIFLVSLTLWILQSGGHGPWKEKIAISDQARENGQEVSRGVEPLWGGWGILEKRSPARTCFCFAFHLLLLVWGLKQDIVKTHSLKEEEICSVTSKSKWSSSCP